jgi:hypothetical protein
MVQHGLDRGHDVVGVCRKQSVAKLDRFKGRITVITGPTDDRDVIRRGAAGCDGVLTVLAPMGVRQYASRTAQALLDRRVDFALFVVAAIENDDLIREAPAIVGCRTPSALAHAVVVLAQEIPCANLATARIPPEAAVRRAS